MTDPESDLLALISARNGRPVDDCDTDAIFWVDLSSF